jgi:tetratricopeptide (TPR) repeat protein
MAAGAAATGLLGGWYQAGGVIAAALVLLALLPICLARGDIGPSPGRMLPLAAAGLALLGLFWSVGVDPYMGCPGLWRAMADCQEIQSEGSAQAEQPDGFDEFLRAEAGRLAGRLDSARRSRLPGPVAARLEPGGLMIRFRGDEVRAELLNGGVAAMELAGRRVGSNPVNLTVALGMAFSAAPERVGLLRPVLEATAEAAALVAADARVSMVSLWDGSATGVLDVVICGPGPLSSGGNPLAVLSRQGLTRVRRRLTEGGVFSLWLPVGRVSLPTLRSAVKTFSEVFPSFLVFLVGREAVFVATDAPVLRFDNLELLRTRLDDAGFWDALELVGDFAADADDLRSLTADTLPYRLSHPCRPPALGRDLLRRPNAVSLAALAQHRTAGLGRLLDRFRFRSENQRTVALRGFGAIYQARTRGILQDVGRVSFARPHEFLGFLRGPLARLDLFASADQEPAVRMGAALSAFGLREAAVEEFRAAVAEGRGSCAVHLELAGVLEELDRFTEALYHYRKAVDQDPQSDVARRRLTALLLGMGRHREAAAALRDTIQRDPENVAALLKLAGLYAGKLNRPKEAARLASKVLEIEPGNALARDLLALTRRPAGRDAGQ